jgi:hypothetical protein
MSDTGPEDKARKSKEDSLAACVEEHRKQLINPNFVTKQTSLV